MKPTYARTSARSARPAYKHWPRSVPIAAVSWSGVRVRGPSRIQTQRPAPCSKPGAAAGVTAVPGKLDRTVEVRYDLEDDSHVTLVPVRLGRDHRLTKETK